MLVSVCHLRARRPQLPKVFLKHAAPDLTGSQPWSATAYSPSPEKVPVPREATPADLERTIEAFGRAAARCESAGFDGVELHGAHGYLLCQFLGKRSNTRSDGWGGDLPGRMRLPLAVYDAVRAATSAQFTVGVRLSPTVAGTHRVHVHATQ